MPTTENLTQPSHMTTVGIEEGQIELFSAAFAPFTIALLVMLAIGVVELVALLVGFSPSASIESALPEVDVPDLDVPELAGPDAPDVPATVELGPFSQI
ncbi:MAG: DUF1449 family protein, partial [Spirochaetaceae bacterium]|nr:DUF1449 family protein [Spirochaetaceae bacterium]